MSPNSADNTSHSPFTDPRPFVTFLTFNGLISFQVLFGSHCRVNAPVFDNALRIIKSYLSQRTVKLTLCPKFDGSQSHSESLWIRDKMKDFICYSATCSHIRAASVSYRCKLHNFHTIANLILRCNTWTTLASDNWNLWKPSVWNTSARSSKFTGVVVY